MAKILVVDDERSIRNTLKDILEFENIRSPWQKTVRKGWSLQKIIFSISSFQISECPRWTEWNY